jgi:hypothetical protein
MTVMYLCEYGAIFLQLVAAMQHFVEYEIAVNLGASFIFAVLL